MTTYGYMGRLLFVDLTSGESRVEALDEQVCRDFLGGYGLGARILYERMPAGVDPLGPENLLGFVTGPFTGTPAICSGRFTVVGKSPLTGGWGDANCGGVFGPYLRFAGYDAVFFSGIAETPTYVVIDDGNVTLRDAAAVWGKDCLDTEDQLKATHGDDAAVACIGPAGEDLSLLSCIITDKGRAAARSGLGAVMGAKRLKALVVRGSQEVPIPDPAKARELRKKWAGQLQGEGVDFKTHGTTSRTIPNTVIGDTPIKNWAGAYPEDFSDPSLDRIDEHAFFAERDKPYGCWHCHIRCGGHLKQKPGRARVSHVPEYETIAMCGPLCNNDDLESIIRFNDICNVYGVDTISVGAAVAFAMECYERGILTEEDLGMKLPFGDGVAVVALAEKIARREGIGALLADGVMRAAERIGKGAEQYAVHAGGQELPAHDPRFYPSLALVYRLDATPGRHSRGGSSWIAGLGFMESPADKYQAAGIGESHKRASAMCHVMASCGNCLFAYTSHPSGYIPEFLTALTGHEHDFESCVRIGERIENIRHLFNLREGINPLRIAFNERALGRPPLQKGAIAGITIDEDGMIADFLAAMQWDPETAMPSPGKLEELGLRELVAELEGLIVSTTEHNVRGLKDAAAFRSYLASHGVTLPFDDEVRSGPESPLARPLVVRDRVIGNRFAILPMEGWDNTTDGKPTDLTRRRWQRWGTSGAKLIFGAEAMAVRPDGRGSPVQLMMIESNLAEISELRALLVRSHEERFSTTEDLLVGVQLTHSGRVAHPNSWDRPEPRTLYHHPILDARYDAQGDDAVMTDDEIENLVGDFVTAARLSHEAGFDFVDIKHCHGYLGHEFLSAVDRPGRYGGSFANRTRFLREIVAGIRAAVPGLEIAVRFSAVDFLPFADGPDDRPEPAAFAGDSYPYAFGGDGSGTGIDLTEPLAFLDLLIDLDVKLVCVSAGAEYNSHVMEPYNSLPVAPRRPPEDPLIGVARLIGLVADLKRQRPDLIYVGSGYSYLQQWLPNVAQAVVSEGWADSVGIGRMSFSYPDMCADVLDGRALQRKRICTTCGYCDVAPGFNVGSGCYALDEFYRGRPEFKILKQRIKEA